MILRGWSMKFLKLQTKKKRSLKRIGVETDKMLAH